MPNGLHLEDEEKIGSDEDVSRIEHETKHEKEPSNKDLLNVYKEDKTEDKKWQKAKNKIIEEQDPYELRVQK